MSSADPIYPSLDCANQRYEISKSLPHHYLNVAITKAGHDGAFQKFERNEIGLWEFYKDFGKELSRVELMNGWYKDWCKGRGIGESNECDQIRHGMRDSTGHEGEEVSWVRDQDRRQDQGLSHQSLSGTCLLSNQCLSCFSILFLSKKRFQRSLKLCR